LKIWGETKRSFLIILECLWTLEELYETTEYSLSLKKKKGNLNHPERDQQ
jgi:hypothetical protein